MTLSLLVCFCDTCNKKNIADLFAGGSASAAGQLVRRLGGDLIGFVFLLELDFLKGRDKLDAPVWTLLTGQKK